MKTAKSLLALLLSLLMILCFAACDEANESLGGGDKTDNNAAAAPVTDVSSEEASSEEPAPLTSVIGVWDREENLMPTLKYGFAHDSKLAEIITKSEIEVILITRIAITEDKKLSVSQFFKEGEAEKLIAEFASVNGTYESLELDRYEMEPTPMNYVEGEGYLDMDGYKLYYTLGTDSITFDDLVSPEGEKAPAGDGNFFTGNTYKKPDLS